MRNHRFQPGFLCGSLLGFAIISLSAGAQTSAEFEWTWMGGSSTPNQIGVPGYLGVPTIANVPSGRYGAASWTDTNGNFWLFGGQGITYSILGAGATFGGSPNDLWEFNPVTNEWAWMGGNRGVTAGSNPGLYGGLGVPSVGNIPGSRVLATTWTDKAGNLWLFGGSGTDSAGTLGILNDLWKFNPSTMEWTWISGSETTLQGASSPGAYGKLGSPAVGNTPSGRSGASSWTDSSGNLWLFGGEGSAPNTSYGGAFNDLWEFNPTTQLWAWMGGSTPTNCGASTCGQSGVYGTLGTPAPGNIPASRVGAASWTDSSGNFWLFGGSVYPSDGSFSYDNDLWEFIPTTQLWAWMGVGTPENCGKAICGAGVYGTLGTPAPGNIPGVRSGASSWTDNSGNLWLFGGLGCDSIYCTGELNDIWKFSPSVNQWAWMGGNNLMNQYGVYGIIGKPDIANTPGSRVNASSWSDRSGNFWLFGGQGYATLVASPLTPTFGSLNDLWLYQPPTTAEVPSDFTVAASPGAITVVAGQSGTAAVTVSPQPGLTSTISFSCSSGLPAGATCSFSPATVTPNGAASSTTLTLTTSATKAALRHNGGLLFPEAVFAAVLLGFGFKRRRCLQMLVLAAVGAIGLGLINGCGGGSSYNGSAPVSPKPQPVTSIVTVTATTGQLTHSTTISLTVN